MATNQEPEPTTAEHIGLFHKTLASSLARPDTDPEAATVEAAHASGLHAYVVRLEKSIDSKRKEIGVLSAQATRPPTAVEGDPEQGLTPFEAAAPVLRAQAKAKVLRAIGVLVTEVGLLGLALWAISVLVSPRHPEDPGRPHDPFPRLALFVAIGLMIVSALGGIVFMA